MLLRVGPTVGVGALLVMSGAVLILHTAGLLVVSVLHAVRSTSAVPCTSTCNGPSFITSRTE